MALSNLTNLENFQAILVRHFGYMGNRRISKSCTDATVPIVKDFW